MELLLNTDYKDLLLDHHENLAPIYLNNGIYGVFGPTGSGTTKLLKDLSSLSSNSANISLILEDDEKYSDNIINHISFIPKDFAIYGSYTPENYLTYIALLKGYNKKELKNIVNYYLKALDLVEFKNIPIKKIKGNQKSVAMRLVLGSAFLGDSKVILIDKLFTNISLSELESFRNLIKFLSQNKIVIISSHSMEKLEPLCDKMLFLNKNKVVLYDTLENNLRILKNKIFTITTKDKNEMKDIENKYTILSINKSKNYNLYRVFSDAVPINDYVVPEKPKFQDLYRYLYESSYEMNF